MVFVKFADQNQRSRAKAVKYLVCYLLLAGKDLIIMPQLLRQVIKPANMQIPILCNSLNFIAYQKRMYLLRAAGADLRVFGWTRLDAVASVNFVEYEAIGVMRTGARFSRVTQILKTIFVAFHLAERHQMIYAMGLEMALASLVGSYLARKRIVLIYEVHDIREEMLREGFLGLLLRALEKRIVKRTQVLVITSEAYIESYFKGILDVCPQNHIVIYNKALLPISHRSSRTSCSAPFREKTLTVGYFGSIRCKQSLSFLEKLTKKLGNGIQIVIYGRPLGLIDFDQLVAGNENISYRGEYEELNDLQRIYQEVDMIWIAGNHGKRSIKWARSCRFHNACFFRTPIISNLNTVEGETVRLYKIGISIDLNDSESAIEKLKCISQDTLLAWRNNFAMVPNSYIVYESEHDELLKLLDSLAGQIS